MVKAGWWWFAFAWAWLGLLAVSATGFERSAAAVVLAQTQAAAERVPSNCLAIAQSLPRATYVNLSPQQANVPAGSVRIGYVGHSTFWIESPGGVTIATDFAGWAGNRGIPRVVTMNKAHETHYTDNPDPAIEHVLRGWNPEGGPAEHNVEVDDVLIRNVTTDIRAWGVPEKDANSIFIFEISGLCIGHLGHLHHELGSEHVGWIGRLDVVMVPVDGSYTLPTENMIEVIKLLRARVVLPMHAFGEWSLNQFVTGLSKDFAVRRGEITTLSLSLDTLPASPTVIVMDPSS
jgi:L-ascorbate metabolism protein UlaG (beta-lactamase superfamily)